MTMGGQKREIRSWIWRCGVLFLLLAGFFVNTVLVRRNIKTIVKEQIHNSNLEFAAHLSERITRGQTFVADLADTIGRMPEHLVTEDMLRRKQAAAGMEQMLLIPREGRSELPATLDGQDLTVWARTAPLWGGPAITAWEDESILLSSPVVREGRVHAVLIGVCSYQKLYGSTGDTGVWQDGIRALVDGSTGELRIFQRGSSSQGIMEHVPQLLEELESSNYQADLYHDGLLVCVLPVAGTNWYQISAAHEDTLLQQVMRHVLVYFGLTLAGVLGLLVAMFRMRRQMTQRERLLLTDPLTGGWNRSGFIQAGSRILQEGGEKNWQIVSLNILEFRNINHMWGEETGDITLRFVYRSFQAILKPGELLCRSSMDRFLLLLEEKDPARLARRVEGAISDINQLIQRSYGDYTLRFTVGVSPVEGDLPQAISNANDAAKRGGQENRCVLFDQAILERIQEEAWLNEMFDSALREGRFQVYLQPQVSLRPGRPCRAEALVRWEDPQRGLIFPEKFISLFEENDKIFQLDLYMFEAVCRILAQWRDQGKPMTQVAVNISRFHIRDQGTDTWKQYQQIKERYRIPDGMIQVELTETVMMDLNQIHFVKEILHNFRACGIPVALDDFGFAYSSLSLLKEFEVDTVKLDRSFFLEETQKSRCIVKNLILLAQNLDIEVVAEGIEDPEQVQALKAMNCDYIQGYIYSKPIPLDQFELWRENHPQG